MQVVSGKVYLVGAGPGDPELITVRGLSLLGECDAVVHDNLVPLELLTDLPTTTEIHYVGKQAGDHTLSQDEINQLLVDLARAGKCVVRLKGSDPLIFGRGGEEARYLKKHGVPFEIVPGVTSGIAGPAYAGIPVTDRSAASWVMCLTGHRASSADAVDVPWEWVSQAKRGTLVIYMGVSEIERIAKRLCDGGLPPDTPAAIIERGTMPSGRSIACTLDSLAETASRERVRPPALFVIGQTVDLKQQMTWLEDRPLLGIRVMVTRPATQAKAMCTSLRRLGAEVLLYPTIGATEVTNETGWGKLNRAIGTGGWLIFTSENGVQFFMRQFLKRFEDIRNLGKFKIAVVGSGTDAALANFRMKADFMPSQATTTYLADELPKAHDLKDTCAFRVRCNLSNQIVEESLIGASADVTPLEVYQTSKTIWPDHLKTKLLEFPPDVITFTSGSTVEGLVENLTSDELVVITEKALCASIGPMTSETMRRYDLIPTVEASVHSVPGLVDAMIEYFAHNPLKRSQ